MAKLVTLLQSERPRASRLIDLCQVKETHPYPNLAGLRTPTCADVKREPPVRGSLSGLSSPRVGGRETRSLICSPLDAKINKILVQDSGRLPNHIPFRPPRLCALDGTLFGDNATPGTTISVATASFKVDMAIPTRKSEVTPDRAACTIAARVYRLNYTCESRLG